MELKRLGLPAMIRKRETVNKAGLFQKSKAEANASALLQRGRDSNPRCSYPHTNFPGLLLQPLGHLSKYLRMQRTQKNIS